MKRNCIFCDKELDTREFDCVRLPGGKFLYYCCFACMDKKGGYDNTLEEICRDHVRKTL